MDLQEIVVEKLTAANLDELRDLSIETFYESFIWGNTEENMKAYMDRFFSKEKLAEELAEPDSIFYFARLNERAVGYLKINIGKAQTELKTNDAVEIERIYVHKDFRGKNIGQLLFDKALEIARNNKAQFMWLGVWEKNPAAIKFYERNGLSQFGTHSFKLGDDQQTDIMMKLSLA